MRGRRGPPLIQQVPETVLHLKVDVELFAILLSGACKRQRLNRRYRHQCREQSCTRYYIRNRWASTCKGTNHTYCNVAIIAILPVVAKDLPISPRFSPYVFLSRCKFSTLTTRQPRVEFHLLYLHSHAFRYGSQKINPALTRIELTTFALRLLSGLL